MNALHRNQQNIIASLEHLNRATGHRYAIRREGANYVLVSQSGEYAPRSAMELRETLLSLRIAAVGR